MNLWFATNNIHKKEELEAILNIGLIIPSQQGIKFEPNETGKTFCENALLKAQELWQLAGIKRTACNDVSRIAVIADDSGLCVDALGGRPGVLSARYCGKQSLEMENKKLTCHKRNLLLLEELDGNPLRSARFVCAMVLLLNCDRFYIIQETLKGEIVKNHEMLRGDGGFGYDPIFLIPELGKTLAELSAGEKNSLSHRGKAGKIISDILPRSLQQCFQYNSN